MFSSVSTEMEIFAPSLTAGDLADCSWLDVASHEPLLRSWAGFPGAVTTTAVRHPGAIPTAVATTGSVFMHAEAAARYYPRPDVRFVPLEGAPVQVSIATRTGDRRPGAEAFRTAAAVVRTMASM
jgi:hypothetical protein